MAVLTQEPAAPARTISTGVPGLDYELALAGSEEAAELALSVCHTAERLGVPFQGELPLMEMPLGDVLDRQLTRAWTIQLRGMTKLQQSKLPMLLDLLARVEYSVGEFQNAQRNFMALAHLGDDQEQQALARYHAFRSALERPNFPDASVELRYAAGLAPRRPVSCHHWRKCSSPAALEWDPSFKNNADPSGRAVKGVHKAAS